MSGPFGLGLRVPTVEESDEIRSSPQVHRVMTAMARSCHPDEVARMMRDEL